MLPPSLSLPLTVTSLSPSPILSQHYLKGKKKGEKGGSPKERGKKELRLAIQLLSNKG